MSSAPSHSSRLSTALLLAGLLGFLGSPAAMADAPAANVTAPQTITLKATIPSWVRVVIFDNSAKTVDLNGSLMSLPQFVVDGAVETNSPTNIKVTHSIPSQLVFEQVGNSSNFFLATVTGNIGPYGVGQGGVSFQPLSLSAVNFGSNGQSPIHLLVNVNTTGNYAFTPLTLPGTYKSNFTISAAFAP